MSRSKNGDAGQPKAAGLSEVEELRAEVERLKGDDLDAYLRDERAGLIAERDEYRRQWHQGVENFERETVRAEAAEARLRAVEALADEWENRPHPEGAEGSQDWVYRMHASSLGSILRAALASAAPAVSERTRLDEHNESVLRASALGLPAPAVSDGEGATSEACLGVRVVGQMWALLCDDDGWVRSGMWHWGTDYKCTGSVHPPLDSPIWPGHEIRCANPIHVVKVQPGGTFTFNTTTVPASPVVAPSATEAPQAPTEQEGRCECGHRFERHSNLGCLVEVGNAGTGSVADAVFCRCTKPTPSPRPDTADDE